jgi:hypothetical protein
VKTLEKLSIARFNSRYITISEFNRSIHKKGEIFCPFCNPPLEVTGVENKFFRALPNRGGHNCGRLAPEYFNAEWEGRRLIEIISGNVGEIELLIDINSLNKMGKNMKITDELLQSSNNNTNTNTQKEFNKYNTYRKVFRDVIRTISQMKKLIEHNSIDQLGMIKFKYKVGNENLGINEVVILIDELNSSLIGKERFVIYVVDSVRIHNGHIYINSYETEGKSITTSFSYPSVQNKTGIKKDDMIIGFGKINYHEPSKKYYLNMLSDLNIAKIDDEILKERFRNKEMKRREFIKIDTSVDEHNIKNIPENSVNISQKQEIVSTTPLHIDPYIKNEIKRSNSLSEKPIPKIETTNYSNNDAYQKSKAKYTKISKLIKVFNNIFQKKQ